MAAGNWRGQAPPLLLYTAQKELQMTTQKTNRRLIGQILTDGGFLSPRDLELALEEQRHTNELLGQVLVRMRILDPADLKAALSVQEYVDKAEDAARIAAGVRGLLGELLVQAGHIKAGQLEEALAEQKVSGEKLGEVLVRKGLLTDRQLNVVLEFQQNQSSEKQAASPLRLGEILISAGYISRYQLEDALYKQTLSRKKLGDILIEEGHVHPSHIKHGLRLQHMLMAVVLSALLTACGGPAGNVDNNSGAEDVVQYEEVAQANYFTVQSDDYNIQTPNFFYSTDNESFWSMQANIATDIYDPELQNIIRIDIQKENNSMPSIGKTFSIEESSQYEKFPGTFLVFNGQESTRKKVEQGIISFTSDSNESGYINGAFDVIMTDYDSTTVPTPQFHIKGEFSVKMGTYGPITPFPA